MAVGAVGRQGEVVIALVPTTDKRGLSVLRLRSL